jgi:hypothetical protein
MGLSTTFYASFLFHFGGILPSLTMKPDDCIVL